MSNKINHVSDSECEQTQCCDFFVKNILVKFVESAGLPKVYELFWHCGNKYILVNESR